MTKNQCYIGTPNGVLLCMDKAGPDDVSGRIWHGYSEECFVFHQWSQAVRVMEQLFDRIQFPFPSTSFRTFDGYQRAVRHTQEVPRIMSDNELLKKRGDLGTFIVRVQHRQNSSWQGRITWMEEDKTVYFRSIWEMIKLVENALDSTEPVDPDEKEISWD